MEEKYLLDRLEEYGNSDYYPFHMPGHKRKNMMEGREFPSPWSIDITEIDGFDNLHHPEGILKRSMEKAAAVYGADHTYYLVNGSTCGILSAVCGTVPPGGKILMARNCHKSVYNGLVLNRLTPVFLYPQMPPDCGYPGSIRPEDVENCLKEDHNRSVRAVLVTSPTYEGIVSDIRAIAGIAHRYGIPLIVDEAHGAHLSFAAEQSGFPEPALSCGADVVIQSLHKTLPCFTQTALLHLKGKLADREKVERYLGIFQSSSPSYLFMAGIEQCIFYMNGSGRKKMEQYGNMLRNFFTSAAELRNLEVPDGFEESGDGIFSRDPSKIVISTKKAGNMDGNRLGELLRSRYHLEMEMCAPEHVVAMTSPADTEIGFSRLIGALKEIDEALEREQGKEMEKVKTDIPPAEVCMPPDRALNSQAERRNMKEAAGTVSAEFVYLYPPGIPVLAPGERIREEAVFMIQQFLKAGLPVQGLSDRSCSTILTVAEKECFMVQ